MTARADTGPYIPETWRDLGRPQQLLLWAVRTWVHGVKRGLCPEASLTEGLFGFGLSGAVPALDHFLITIAEHAAGAFDVRCPPCRQVSADERALIAFVDTFRDTNAHGSAAAAIGRFAGLVDAAGMTDCIRAAFLLAVDFFPPDRAAADEAAAGAADRPAAAFVHAPSTAIH